jgi:hypothetical protein
MCGFFFFFNCRFFGVLSNELILFVRTLKKANLDGTITPLIENLPFLQVLDLEDSNNQNVFLKNTTSNNALL